MGLNDPPEPSHVDNSGGPGALGSSAGEYLDLDTSSGGYNNLSDWSNGGYFGDSGGYSSDNSFTDSGTSFSDSGSSFSNDN